MMSPNIGTHLSTAECWVLLENERVGRLAVTDAAGTPDIFPVNFVAYEGAVYIRTAPDAKVTRLISHPAAAFEVDGYDGAGWWSVVLHGTAARINDPVEIERSGVSRLLTASPRHKQHVLKVAPSAITGRRFADREQIGRIAPRRSDPTPHQVAPDPDDNHQRGERPETIPSHQPWAAGVSLDDPTR